jgi:WD40 repeat protein
LDNRWLLGTPPEGGLTLFDLRAARQVLRYGDYYTGRFRVASFSPDARWFAYGTTNSTVRIWDLAANREKVTLVGHKWFVVPIQFSRDGKIVATGGIDNDVWLWSVDTGKPIFPSMQGHQVGVKFAVFSFDGKTLVTASDDGATRWWSVVTGKEMLLSENLKRIWQGFAVAPSAPWDLGGKLLVWQEPEGMIRVTTLPTLAEIDAAEAQQAKEAQSR